MNPVVAHDFIDVSDVAVLGDQNELQPISHHDGVEHFGEFVDQSVS